MENINLILQIFSFALLYISLYALNRILTEANYFGFAEVIYGHKGSISFLSIILKLLIPLVYAPFIYFLTKSEFISLSAIFWGSVLIVTPPFFDFHCLDERLCDKKYLLYFVYIIFVLLNLFVSKFSIIFLKIIKQFLTGYLAQYNSPQLLFNHVMDIVILPIVVTILLSILKLIFNKLDEKIKLYYGDDNDIDEG